MDAVESLAIGVGRRPSGTVSADRSWARALVIRHCRRAPVALVEIYELHDDEHRNADIIQRLSDLAADTHAQVLVTDGVCSARVVGLITDLGLRHHVVQRRDTVPSQRTSRRSEPPRGLTNGWAACGETAMARTGGR